MSRYTSEDAVNAIGNRYDLILIASARARDLAKGHRSMLNSKSGNVVKALEEIEAKQVTRDYVAKSQRIK